MDHHHLPVLDSCSRKSNAAVAAWARREGKSDAMSADLLRSTACNRQHKRQQLAIIASDRVLCHRCIASATIGAALALLLDRIIIGG